MQHFKTPDGVIRAIDQGQEYLVGSDWQELTAEELSAELNPAPATVEIIARMEAVVDRHADTVAAASGYGRVGVSPSVACLGYAGYPNAYQSEAIAYGEWLASLWPVCFQILSDVQAERRPTPTEEELISELPAMVWPA